MWLKCLYKLLQIRHRVTLYSGDLVEGRRKFVGNKTRYSNRLTAKFLAPTVIREKVTTYKYCAVRSRFALQANELPVYQYQQARPIGLLLRRTPVLPMTRTGLWCAAV